MQSDLVKYWVDISDYDLETAKAMIDSKRFLYVGFMCHQTIEKTLKALYCSIENKPAPFTHKLSILAEQTEIFYQLPDNLKDLLDKLEPLNIEARYPTDKDKLLNELNLEVCSTLLKDTERMQNWIKQTLLK